LGWTGNAEQVAMMEMSLVIIAQEMRAMRL
jgi:hypothetical protein